MMFSVLFLLFLFSLLSFSSCGVSVVVEVEIPQKAADEADHQATRPSPAEILDDPRKLKPFLDNNENSEFELNLAPFAASSGYSNALASSVVLNEDARVFDLWKRKFNKFYTPEEEKMKFEAFRTNLHASARLGVSVGLNGFYDSQPEDLVVTLMNPRADRTRKRGINRRTNKPLMDTQDNEGEFEINSASVQQPLISRLFTGSYPIRSLLPPLAIGAEVDWRQKIAFSPVGSQKLCGACFSFTVSSYLESLYQIQYPGKPFVSVSPQALMDCSGGCSGYNIAELVELFAGQKQIEENTAQEKTPGVLLPTDAFAVRDLSDYSVGLIFPVPTQEEIPYREAQRSCLFTGAVNQFKQIQSQRDNKLLHPALVYSPPLTRSPIAIKSVVRVDPGRLPPIIVIRRALALAPVPALACFNPRLWEYPADGFLTNQICKGFVASECAPNKVKTNHAILIIGYGKEPGPNGRSYWIFRNSYSEKFGLNGYGKIQMGGNACNLESETINYLMITQLI